MFDQTTDLCRRGNIDMFFIVEMACNMCDDRYAASFMARNNVPIEVARRVLLNPHLRRRMK